MKFRFHRGTLEESMATVVDFETNEDLVKIINRACGFKLKGTQDLSIEYYSQDDRIGWTTYSVALKGRMIPIGFTNGIIFGLEHCSSPEGCKKILQFIADNNPVKDFLKRIKK